MFTEVWGARSGQAKTDRAPFLDAVDVPKLPMWNNVAIVSVKEDLTKKDKPFLWIMYRQVDGQWVHRQAYFRSQQLYPLLTLFDIHDGIKDSEEVVGKKLWVNFDTEKWKGSDQSRARIIGYSLEKQSGPQSDVPF